MSRLSTIVLAVATLVAAGPALADSPQVTAAESAEPATTEPQRVKRLGTRMDIVVVHGAVDPKKQRWSDSGKATPVLPTVSESAFLEDDDAAGVEPRVDSQ